ncbi:MAG: four helix bundle protein [Bacteroidota bacterium]
MTEDRKNINRGFRKLRVWNDAIDLYVLACKIFPKLSREQLKVVSNSIDAAHSISRNIAEGYCRKSIKEYLNFLNYALGSCGELYSCYFACHKMQQISDTDFENLDQLHFKVENELLKLIESLQLKLKEGNWEDSFVK